MNMSLMWLVEEVAGFMYKDNKSQMIDCIGTVVGAERMNHMSNELLRISKENFTKPDSTVNGKEVTLAGNVLSLFSSTYLFMKACMIVDKKPVEPSALCEDLSHVITKYMECTYLTSAVDRKEAAESLVKRIDEMNFSLSKVLAETEGTNMESISYITATKFALRETLEEIRDIGVDTVNCP